MKALVIYLAEVTIISGLLHGYYHFFLRNKKFHAYNRYYLLGLVVLSLVLPLLNIPVYFRSAATEFSQDLIFPAFGTGSHREDQLYVPEKITPSLFSVTNIFLGIYLLFSLAFLARLFFIYKKLRRIIRSHPVERFPDLNFVRCEEQGTPFSFFRWMFWNKSLDINSPEGEQVFRHEWFHIRQKHSYDVLFLELVTLVLWINPFFHFVKREIRTIHEFLADRFAIGGSQEGKYAELLLMQALQTRVRLVHPFFHNQIKRRISMITQSNDPRTRYFRKLMVLPLAGILALLFSFSYRNKTNPTARPATPLVVMLDPGHGAGTGARFGGLVEDDVVLELAKMIREKSKDRNIEVLLTREGNSNPPLAERKARAEESGANLYISLHTAAGNQPGGISIYVPSKRVSGQSNSLATALINKIRTVYATQETLKQSSMSLYVLEQITLPSILIEVGNISMNEDNDFLSAKNNLEKLAEAILDGIASYPSVPYSDNRIVITDTIKPREQVPVKKDKKETVEILEEPIYVIDGKIDTSVHSWKVDTRFTKEIVKSVTILKGPQGKEKYGPAASGGVIEITLKPKSVNSQDLFDKIPKISVPELRSASVHRLLGLDPGTDVISFTFTIDLPNGDIARVPGTGQSFNAPTSELIANAAPGRLITIDLIRIRVDGKEKKIPSKIYGVVE
jgi:N-acetylmuramoyl-L-alanine amidase